MIAFDKIPAAKPSQNASINPGRYPVQIKKAEILESKKNPGAEYLAVTFITKDKEIIIENYFDIAKPFLMYKLGRLLRACDIQLEGTGALKDIAKLIVNKKVTIDVVVNDQGYANLDYSGTKEGVYTRAETSNDPFENVEEPAVLDEEVAEAITEDADF